MSPVSQIVYPTQTCRVHGQPGIILKFISFKSICCRVRSGHSLILPSTLPVRRSADLRSGTLPSGLLSRPGRRPVDGSGGRLVCRKGLASRRPKRMPTEVDGSETIHNIRNFGVFYPPGATPRLYGRQDARRHGTTVQYANVNMNCYAIYAAHECP